MIDRILRSRPIIIVAVVTLCCFLLWSGGSVVAAASVAFVVVFCIILPGVFICLSCNQKENILPSAFVVGSAVFALCYLFSLLSEVFAVFYGVPLLLGALGLFKLFGGEYRPEIHRHWLALSIPVLLFAISTLPMVALPKFDLVPLADSSVYQKAAEAVLLLPSESIVSSPPQTIEFLDLLSAAVSHFVGVPVYDTVAFYLPLFLLCLSAISVYNLADRYLKNRHRALLATLVFFFASPLCIPMLDDGFFASERLIVSPEYSFLLIAFIAALLSMSAAITKTTGSRLYSLTTLLPSLGVFCILCITLPLYAAFLLLIIFSIALIYTFTGRFYLRIYCLLLGFGALFALLCRDFVATITFVEQFEISELFDQLLRNSYTSSIVVYYILLPITIILSIIMVVFPIMLPLLSEGRKSITNLRGSGMLRISFLLLSSFGLLATFFLQNAFTPMIVVIFAVGSVTIFRSFARKKGALAVVFVVLSVAVGAFNLSVKIYEGTVLQLQGFGYIEYDEQEMMDPQLLNALYYIRDNTDDAALLMTDYEGGYEATALSQRRFVEPSERVFDGNLADETLRETLLQHDVDYLLAEGSPERFDSLTILYESGEYTVFGL